MNCPICNETLDYDYADPRQEWVREYYTCPRCCNNFSYYTVFKQNGDIKSQGFEYEETFEELQDVYDEMVKNLSIKKSAFSNGGTMVETIYNDSKKVRKT